MLYFFCCTLLCILLCCKVNKDFQQPAEEKLLQKRTFLKKTSCLFFKLKSLEQQIGFWKYTGAHQTLPCALHWKEQKHHQSLRPMSGWMPLCLCLQETKQQTHKQPTNLKPINKSINFKNICNYFAEKLQSCAKKKRFNTDKNSGLQGFVSTESK